MIMPVIPKDKKTHSLLFEQGSIKILAPAKINVLLKITGVRADGYHEIVAIFVPVALYDRLIIATAEEGLKVKFY